MNHYKKIPIWENRRRTKLLLDFREIVSIYFNNLTYSDADRQIYEKEKAQEMRKKINFRIARIHSYVLFADVTPVIHYIPPPIVGGLSREVDLFTNIFDLHRFKLSYKKLIDLIEITIGKYNDDKKNAWFRTFNPFFWLNKIIDFLVKIPFNFAKKIGFDQRKIELSIFGIIIKGFLYFIYYLTAFIASLLIILNLTGQLNKLITLIR